MHLESAFEDALLQRLLSQSVSEKDEVAALVRVSREPDQLHENALLLQHRMGVQQHVAEAIAYGALRARTLERPRIAAQFEAEAVIAAASGIYGEVALSENTMLAGIIDDVVDRAVSFVSASEPLGLLLLPFPAPEPASPAGTEPAAAADAPDVPSEPAEVVSQETPSVITPEGLLSELLQPLTSVIATTAISPAAAGPDTSSPGALASWARDLIAGAAERRALSSSLLHTPAAAVGPVLKGLTRATCGIPPPPSTALCCVAIVGPPYSGRHSVGRSVVEAAGDKLLLMDALHELAPTDAAAAVASAVRDCDPTVVVVVAGWPSNREQLAAAVELVAAGKLRFDAVIRLDASSQACASRASQLILVDGHLATYADVPAEPDAHVLESIVPLSPPPELPAHLAEWQAARPALPLLGCKPRGIDAEAPLDEVASAVAALVDRAAKKAYARREDAATGFEAERAAVDDALDDAVMFALRAEAQDTHGLPLPEACHRDPQIPYLPPLVAQAVLDRHKALASEAFEELACRLLAQSYASKVTSSVLASDSRNRCLSLLTLPYPEAQAAVDAAMEAWNQVPAASLDAEKVRADLALRAARLQAKLIESAQTRMQRCKAVLEASRASLEADFTVLGAALLPLVKELLGLALRRVANDLSTVMAAATLQVATDFDPLAPAGARGSDEERPAPAVIPAVSLSFLDAFEAATPPSEVSIVLELGLAPTEPAKDKGKKPAAPALAPHTVALPPLPSVTPARPASRSGSARKKPAAGASSSSSAQVGPAPASPVVQARWLFDAAERLCSGIGEAVTALFADAQAMEPTKVPPGPGFADCVRHVSETVLTAIKTLRSETMHTLDVLSPTGSLAALFYAPCTQAVTAALDARLAACRQVGTHFERAALAGAVIPHPVTIYSCGQPFVCGGAAIASRERLPRLLPPPTRTQTAFASYHASLVSAVCDSLSPTVCSATASLPRLVTVDALAAAFSCLADSKQLPDPFCSVRLLPAEKLAATVPPSRGATPTMPHTPLEALSEREGDTVSGIATHEEWGALARAIALQTHRGPLVLLQPLLASLCLPRALTDAELAAFAERARAIPGTMTLDGLLELGGPFTGTEIHCNTDALLHLFRTYCTECDDQEAADRILLSLAAADDPSQGLGRARALLGVEEDHDCIEPVETAAAILALFSIADLVPPHLAVEAAGKLVTRVDAEAIMSAAAQARQVAVANHKARVQAALWAVSRLQASEDEQRSRAGSRATSRAAPAKTSRPSSRVARPPSKAKR
jgi:hypothetical protein